MAYRKYSLLLVPLTGIAWLSISPAGGQPKQPITGPEASYWIAAETVTGFGAMGAGSSLGALMSGRPEANGQQRLLQLYLGSQVRPSAPPEANHFPPTGLAVGASLPLLSPEKPQAAPRVREYGEHDGPDEPEGRILIYWGCGEKARVGPPVIIDFSKPAANPASMFSGVNMAGLRLPTSEKFETFGEWPNKKSAKKIPSAGSLIGDHIIKANYAPEIRLTLGAANDFLSPLQPRNAALSSGAQQLKWPAIPNAKAYFAGVTGSAGNRDMVIWSSSELRLAAMALPPYLGQAEIARLLDQKVLMGPQQTECVIPGEVAKYAQNGGMLMMTAFGQEADFVFPARPTDPAKAWNIQWRAKVLSKATFMGMLGGENEGEAGQEHQDNQNSQSEPAPPAPEKQKKHSIFQKLGGLPI